VIALTCLSSRAWSVRIGATAHIADFAERQQYKR
jgi:hypothetical protein